MFDFNYEHNFQPDANALNLSLFTPKRASNSYGVIRPGLFNNPDYIWYAFGFFAILVLEGWALAITYEHVEIQLIAALVVFDFFLAIFSHLPQKTIIKNKNIVLFETNKTKIEAANRAIASKTRTKWFWYSLILGSGFLKAWFFFLGYGSFDATSFAVCVFYIIGAILHILCTGYALYTLFTKIRFNSQFSGYISSSGQKHQATSRSHALNSTVDLVEATVGKHHLEKKGSGFQFRTFGVLTDSELGEFIGKQVNPEQQRVVAIEGVKHQFNMLS
jgi:hypothetical protein